MSGGAEEDRTPDLLRARQALSQLSYGPVVFSERPELRAARAIASYRCFFISLQRSLMPNAWQKSVVINRNPEPN